MESDSPRVKLRRSHSPAQSFNSNPEIANTSKDGILDGTNDAIKRRIRPKSASYAALRSAVFKLTSLNDFIMEKIGSGFFADVYKVFLTSHRGQAVNISNISNLKATLSL